MGQDRKKWQSEGDVFLKLYEQEKQEDKKEEKRLFWVQASLLAGIALGAIFREMVYPSNLIWMEKLKELLEKIQLFH